MHYRFADFVIDEDAYRLRCGGRDVPLRRQALDVLLLLVSKAPRVVSRSELFERVWNGSRVTDNAVTQCVREIRRALGEKGRESSLVQTVHGRGFRFNAEVIPEASRVSSSPSRADANGGDSELAALPFEALAAHVESLEPRLLVVRGLEHYYRRTRADNQLAISYLSRAIEEDAASASAPYYLGLAHCNNVYYQWHENWQQSLSRVLWAADQSRQRAPGQASSHILDGLLYLFAGDGDSARVSAELAVEASPSMAEAHALLGRVLAVTGHGDAAIDRVKRAITLSPGDPWPGDLISALAIGEFAAERYREADHHAQRAIHYAPHHLTSHFVMAASRALSGEVEEASVVAHAVRSLPRFSTAPLRRILSSSPGDLADRFFTGLSLAGLSDSP